MKSIINLPQNLQKAWYPLSYKIHVPLQYTTSLSSVSYIPKGAEILEIDE